MNIRKVIKYLKESKCDQKQGENYQQYHNSVLNTAIEALEKQIPKKPEKILKAFEYRFGDCPNCNKSSDVNYKYCKNCGQKLDWK